MTKAEWISLVKNELMKVDETRRYDVRIIEKALTTVRSTLFNRKFNQHELSQYSKAYPDISGSLVACTLDSSGRNLYYSSLPAELEELPQKGKGIIAINTKIGTDFNFYPTNIYMGSYLSTSFARDIRTMIVYSLEGDKIWYTGMTAEVGSVGVRMNLIVKFDEYASTEDVPMPPTFRPDITIIDLAVAQLRQTAPVDLIADNNE